MYVRKILDIIICNNYIVTCTELLDYDKILLCKKIEFLYCIMLTNFIIISI